MLSAPAKRRNGNITLMSSKSKSNCLVNELAASRNSGKINPTIRTTKDRAIARIIKPIVWGNFRNLKLITEKTEANKRRTVESSNISIIVFLYALAKYSKLI